MARQANSPVDLHFGFPLTGTSAITLKSSRWTCLGQSRLPKRMSRQRIDGPCGPRGGLVLLGKTRWSGLAGPTLLAPRRGHILANRASISGHESGSRMPDQAGERIMSVQRVWKPVGSVNSNAEIERLRLELASFNERIEELEKQHPDASEDRGTQGKRTRASAPD